MEPWNKEWKSRLRISILLGFFTIFFLDAISLAWAGAQEDLFRAAFEGDLHRMKVALSNGANIKAREGNGISVLMSALPSGWGPNATESGKFKTVQFLLSHGADVNARDKEGTTALMLASGLTRGGYEKVCQLLLKAGANVNAKNNFGNTALMAAVLHAPIVRLLIDHGANVNAKGRFGKTALMDAASFGDFESAQALLKAGADVNAKDNKGKTALDIAQKQGNTIIVALINKYSPKSSQKIDSNEVLLKENEREDQDSEVPIIHHGSIEEWTCHQQIKWYTFFKSKRLKGVPKYKAVDILNKYRNHVDPDVFTFAMFPAESYVYNISREMLKVFDPARDLSDCQTVAKEESYYKLHSQQKHSRLSYQTVPSSIQKKIYYILDHNGVGLCADLALAAENFAFNRNNDMPYIVAKKRLSKWLSLKRETARRVDKSFNKNKYLYMSDVYSYLLSIVYRKNKNYLNNSGFYDNIYYWCHRG